MNTLILCIYGRAGYECLNYILLKDNFDYNEVLIFTHKKNNDLLLDFIQKMNLNFCTTSINNCENMINGKKGLLLSIHYRNIIKENIINCFNGMKINLHPSLLPYYKGCFSSVWALINNEKETGITYHILTKNVDEGNILIQEKINISENDTAFSLFNKLITLGIKNLPKLFELIKNKYEGEKQIECGSYYKREIPYNGIINNEWSKKQKELFVRAMYFPPYPGAILIKNNNYITINSISELHENINL